MTRRVPKAFGEAVNTHRNRLQKMLTGKGARQMRGLFDSAASELERKLAAALNARRGDTFTSYQKRVLLAQVKQAQALTTQRLAQRMGPLSREAQEAALNGLVTDVARLSERFTGSEVVLPIEEAGRFAGIVDGRATSLAKQHRVTMAKFGANTVAKVEQKLATSLLTGEASSADVVSSVAETISGEWWQGERIVRTELAYAFNAAHHDGLVESAEELPELRMRWEEQCDDSGQPLDDRVAVDSIAMHGQVVETGKLFTMPATAPFPDALGRTAVPRHLVGEQWPFPPNRPNDRSVLSPWMPGWGVPGWEYRNGRRVWL